MYFVSISTFKNFVFFSKSKPIGVFSIYFIFNTLCLLIYLISQVILVVNTLDEYWPLGNILFAAAFFIIGQVIQFFLSNKICEAIKHYVDGLFFTTICTLLAVMMIYKYWDSITKEDLEFSVGGKGNVWEVKDVVNFDDDFAPYAGQANTNGFAASQSYVNYPNQQYADDKRNDQQAYYQQHPQ
ncbi:hypothetical protein BB561_004275 [Smittium simulii]|uniref:Chitin synthase export chaperone n=1 Tax=Smittium simulii TaxID=133385 RepID=A0A2T9YH99_9FUNG|nr:hypothetical protein BB561_004275 [Smittium simulii]